MLVCTTQNKDVNWNYFLPFLIITMSSSKKFYVDNVECALQEEKLYVFQKVYISYFLLGMLIILVYTDKFLIN